MRVFALDQSGTIVAQSASVPENLVDHALPSVFHGETTGDAVEAAVARSWFSGTERDVMIHDGVLRVMRVPQDRTSLVAWAKTIPPPIDHGLTATELRVMRMYVRGDMTTKEIARALNVAARTVSEHKTSALAKLGCRNLGSAGALMERYGLL